jgi:ATP/maltotriose-dependent transcriptional regulator MalT
VTPAAVATIVARTFRPTGILDRDDSEAVAQAAAWQEQQRYRPECGTPLGVCVGRACRTAILRALRDASGVSEWGRMHGVDRIQTVPLDEALHIGVDGVERTALLRWGLSRLTARQRAVVVGVCEGYSRTEVARQIGCSAQTAADDWIRGIERLRRWL